MKQLQKIFIIAVLACILVLAAITLVIA